MEKYQVITFKTKKGYNSYPLKNGIVLDRDYPAGTEVFLEYKKDITAAECCDFYQCECATCLVQGCTRR